ncbi:nuclear transport factor 2 family protein [Streptomyces sp. NBC_01477]|uniref:nuclear transport factor 2 family protein n=1 Tax=Streptomyces sp. NBC_01477 TaxID=2976015 RepID=UPI002E328698|nr:nuclear transport factor 2 family protein [Streptomyces sp. NBC_01477]
MSQQANEAMAERLIDLYNTDVHAMIDQCYPDDLRIKVNGVLAITDRDKFHKVESEVLGIAPDRRAAITRLLHTGDDTVTAEGTCTFTDTESGATRRTYWCSIWTITDGLVTSDSTYLDASVWTAAGSGSTQSPGAGRARHSDSPGLTAAPSSPPAP